jgi:hypothetical protein
MDITIRLAHIYTTWNNKIYLKHSYNVTSFLLSAGKNKSSWHLLAGFVSSIVFSGLHDFGYSTCPHTFVWFVIGLLWSVMPLWQGAMSIDLKASVHLVWNVSLCFSRDSSVGIATGYWLDGRGVIPTVQRFFFSTAPKPSLKPTQPPIQWVPGIKRPGPEADHSQSFSVTVESGGSISLLLLMSSRHNA